MIFTRKCLFLSSAYLALFTSFFACGRAAGNKSSSTFNAESSPIAIIPLPVPRLIEIPSVVDPRDFASPTNNSLPIDIPITSQALVAQSFSIDFKLSSVDPDAYITVESPPGQLLAHVTGYEGQSEVLSSQLIPSPTAIVKTIPGLIVRPGAQSVRLIFHGETQIEYLDFRREFPSPTSPVRWNKADLTNYTSFPDPLSEECIEYNGCTWAGWFAALDDQQTEGWVKAHNIIAIHSKHFAKYKLKTFRLRSGTKEFDAKVYDMCADSDCEGCCTKNSKKTGFLIDIESYSLNRFQVEDGVIEWRCLDCNIPVTSKDDSKDGP